LVELAGLPKAYLLQVLEVACVSSLARKLLYVRVDVQHNQPGGNFYGNNKRTSA
jgi:hypothetical protein